MRKILLAATLAVVPVTLSYADDQRCVDLVKECFAYSTPERDACFKTVGTHAFCADTNLAELAAKRASLSPVVPNIEERGPAFLGPQLVNPQCLSNFDNSWSAAMINGPISEDTYASLNSVLEQCSQVPASELVRP